MTNKIAALFARGYCVQQYDANPEAQTTVWRHDFAYYRIPRNAVKPQADTDANVFIAPLSDVLRGANVTPT